MQNHILYNKNLEISLNHIQCPLQSSLNKLNLNIFKEKLEKFYIPQAKTKNINFKVHISSGTDKIPFSKNKLLQITGNLISNAIKFIPQNGKVHVNLTLTSDETLNLLRIVVKDSGIGLNQQQINSILKGESASGHGTEGEQGYGFGLVLVKHLIEGLNGAFKISSEGDRASFEVLLPQ